MQNLINFDDVVFDPITEKANDVEEKLLELTKENYSRIFNFILRIINETKSSEYIFRLLLRYSKIRPKNIILYANFWSEIFEVTQKTLSLITVTYHNVVLARLLYNRKVFSQDDVDRNTPWEAIDMRNFIKTYGKPTFKPGLKESRLYHTYPIKSLLDAIKMDNFDLLQQIASEHDFSFTQRVNFSQFDVPMDDKETFQNMTLQNEITLIGFASYYGSCECLKFLLSNRAPILTRLECQYAIMGGNFEIIHIYEQQGATFQGDTLKNAVEFHHNDIANWLYSNFQCNMFSISSAIWAHNTKAVLFACQSLGFDEVLKQEKECNEDYKNPIVFSAEVGYFPIYKAIESCMKLDDTMKITDEMRIDILMKASMSGSIDIIDDLFNNGLDIGNVYDKKKFYALHNACHGGDSSTVRYLLEHGACPDCLNMFKKRPLWYACYYQRYGAAYELLQHGALLDKDLEKVPMSEYLVNLVQEYKVKQEEMVKEKLSKRAPFKAKIVSFILPENYKK